MWLFIKTYPLRYWPWYTAGLLALIATTYITTLIPLEIKYIIDAIQQSLSWDTLKPMVMRLILLATLLAGVRTLSRVLIFTPGRYVEYTLRANIHAHILTIHPRFFSTHTIGDTMSRMINDIQSLRLLSAFGFLHIMNTTLIYTLVIAQMIAIHPTLTLWVLAPIPFVLLVVRFFVKRLYKYIKASQEQLGSITNFFVEAIANMSLIKTYTAEERMITEMQHDNIAYRNTQLKLATVRSTMFPFISTIGSMGLIILMYKGGGYILTDTITIGDFVAFSAYLALLAWPTAAFSWVINIIQRGTAALVRIQELLNAPPHPQYKITHHIPLTNPPTITVKNLTFAYPSNNASSTEPILKNISFTLPAGKRLGIFGATGCGKTTLANILALHQPVNSGQVFFNGTDITSCNVNTLREGIGMVPQRRFLFSDTIANNIAFSNPNGLTQAQCESAATRACVLDDILAFPDQWDTMVGEKGIILSGGQQHRLALARAYAAPHQLLILDDVLSSVDTHTETQMIAQLYNTNTQPVTTVVVSHRISALIPCDTIIVLDAGAIIAQGTHADLIDQPGPYQATWRYQLMETAQWRLTIPTTYATTLGILNVTGYD